MAMGNTLFEGKTGVQVDTFIGPESAPPPRLRIQLGVIDGECGRWQTIVLTPAQWADLHDAVNEIGRTLP